MFDNVQAQITGLKNRDKDVRKSAAAALRKLSDVHAMSKGEE
jgi:hypothetical protein